MCGAEKYATKIDVRRPGKADYETPFFECMACGVMFTDQVKFSTRPMPTEWRDDGRPDTRPILEKKENK